MHRKDLVVQLISEISNFILEKEPHRMVISMHQETDGLHLCIVDDQPRSEEELKAISAALNPGARPELADYYGSMGGSDLLGAARLNLVGWQIKHADVAPSDRGIKIDLWIGGDRFDSRNFTIPDHPVRRDEQQPEG